MSNTGQALPQPPGPPPSTSAAPSGSSSTGAATPASSNQTVVTNNMSNLSSSAPKIEKLKDGNWLAWKTRIATVLKRKEAYEIATGVTPQPLDPDAVSNWKLKDLVAQELITTAIKDEQVVHISECTSSAQMWEALRTIHEPRGQQSILSTKRALYSAQAKEDSDIAAHLNDMKVLRERLGLSGHRIDDMEFKSILVSSLPHSWEAFTTSYLGYQGGTLGNQSAQVMTVQQLVSLLTEEAKRRKEKEDGSEYGFSAKSKNKPKKEKPKLCAICGRTNHVTANCRHKGKPKCDICEKFGHKGEECWRNPLNKGKGRVTKNVGRDHSKSDQKGKQRANITTEDTDSDTESLDKAFTAHVKVIDNEEEADEAEVSVYSWIADSGATSHICAERDAFSNYQELPQKVVKGLGDKPVTACGKGTVTVLSRIENRVTKIRLLEALYVPEARDNLLSLGRIDRAGGTSSCGNGEITIYNKDRKKIAYGRRKYNLYYLNIHTEYSTEKAQLAVKLKKSYTWAEWHRRLGHISITGLRTLHGKNLVDGFTVTDSTQTFDCDACIKSKQTRQPVPKKASRREVKPGEITHSDLWGPAPMPGLKGHRYYISFVDEATRRTRVMYLTSKGEASAKVKHYLTWVEKQDNKSPKIIRVDNGREYINRDLITWCLDKGIEIQTTAPYTPEQNGIAERYNRTVVELARAMLLARDLPRELWPEAVNHACYIRNRAYTRAINDGTPHQKWTGERPDVSSIQEFGVPVWILDEHHTNKLQSKSTEHIFIGYEDGPKAIKYYDRGMRNIKVSRNYRFPLTKLPNAATERRFEGEQRENNEKSRKPDSDDDWEATTTKRSHDDDGESCTKRRKTSVQEDGNKEPLPDLIDDPDEDEPSQAEQIYTAFSDTFIGGKDPKSLKEAKRSSDWPEWEKAIKTELDTLRQMGTWELMEAPKNRKPVTNKWVFVRKYNKEGELLKYKARLVARGFSQVPGMDYNETFAPVVRLETIRAILALAVEEDWEIQQMDVKGAYLNGDLKEEIYMNQPEGFHDETTRLCRLIKTIYGLKQSGREWNHKLNKRLQNRGFKRLETDPCVYIRKGKGRIEIITVWVDDLLLFTKTEAQMTNLKRELGDLFEITDLGEPNKLVGIEIDRDRKNGTLTIKQTKYIESILEKYGLKDANSVSTPLDPNVKLEPLESTDSATADGNYASLTGSLMYAAIGTRPDIAYATNKLCSFNANPSLIHWSAAKRVLRYLKGTKEKGITYRKGGDNKNRLYGYADASFATNSDRSSTSGHVFLLNKGAITWGSRKQRIIALSTAEAEYSAMAEAGRRLTWLRNLYYEIGYTQNEPTVLYADNQSAIAIATNLQYHQRSMHFPICQHYIRQKIRDGDARLEYCTTNEMTADIFTKALPRIKHTQHTQTLGLNAA